MDELRRLEERATDGEIRYIDGKEYRFFTITNTREEADNIIRWIKENGYLGRAMPHYVSYMDGTRDLDSYTIYVRKKSQRSSHEFETYLVTVDKWFMGPGPNYQTVKVRARSREHAEQIVQNRLSVKSQGYSPKILRSKKIKE